MLNIAGYQIIATLYQGNYSIIYRGVKAADTQQSVIIKVPATVPPSKQQIDKLRQEFELRQRIISDHVVKFLELKPDITYGYLLIEEDDHADTLINHLPKNGFEPLPFLNMAIQLVEGLGDIHRSRVIHKDIKPHNIIYLPHTGQVKYIDFNSASLLHQQQQVSMTPMPTTEATLAYISPEQTGRINRLIDYRTDFYSLGVTFYQLLCGRWPFEGKKVAELVYCHLAKQPLFPHAINPTIPKPLSDIIMKLLQKDADNRYQSTYGLLIDLKRCQEELVQKGEITPFTLAEHDISEHFYLPQKLYGRESELSALLQAYRRTNQGQAEIIMITGPAGSGKSVLIQEMQPMVAAQQGYFLMGKFESLKSNIAYSAITQAFQIWVNQILALSQEEITAWKDQLLDALNNQGQLLIDIMPDLELILGKQPPMPTLDPEQTTHRFQWVFQRFIALLAQPAHPLALFLDDWQWADTASLNLLAAIMTSPATKSLLLIGAYRDNEIDTSHPALMTLASLQKAGIAVQTLPLSPLSVTAINQWIAESMHNSIETTLPLTTLLYHKTQELPFFIKVFLQTIYQQGLLILSEGHWHWDLDKIQLLPATENVIAFMIQQMQQLPSATQDTLQFAACLGHRFYFSQLELVTQKPIEQLQAELQLLLDKGFLLQGGGALEFAHDRIQEAIHSLISSKKWADIHLSIGRLLQTKLSSEPNSELLFEVVEHFNQGKTLITDQNEELVLAKLNFEACKKAKSAIAYTVALNYLRMAENYFADLNIWQNQYTFAYAFYKELAEMEYLNGHFETSTSYMEQILIQAQDVIEKVTIYNLRIIHLTLRGLYQDAIDIGYQALSLLGIDLRSQDLQNLLQLELHQVKEALQNKTMDMLLNAPETNRLDIKATLKLLFNLAAPTYLTNNQILHIFLVAKMINLTFQYGNAEESPKGYATYGMFLIYKQGEISLGHEFGLLAIKLSDHFGNPSIQCTINFLYANFIHHWRKPLAEVKTFINHGQQTGLVAGEFEYLSYLAQCKAVCFFYQSVTLTDMNTELNRLLQLPYTHANQLSIAVIHGLQLVVLNLMGKTKKEIIFCDDSQSDKDYQAHWQKEHNFYGLSNYLVLKAQVLYLYGRFEQALDTIMIAESYLTSIPGRIITAISNFYYSLILIALHPTVGTDMQQKYGQQLATNQKQMKIWADNCPENFLHKYLLVSAEMARLANNRLEAEDKYEQAIQAAEQQGFIQEQALANELAANFWLAQHKPNYARGLLQAAYQLYERWGAKHKVNQLILQYCEYLKPSAVKLSSFNISGEEETISTNSLRLLDLTSILKTSQTISSEVDLTKLLVKIMHLLVENAGAQKGAFLVEEFGTLLIQAEYMQDGQIRTLQQLPLSQWEGGAHTIIEYVKRTQQSVLLGNASTEAQFSQDPYVKAHHLQSVLCLPVIRHHQLKSILYLENNLAAYMFTGQHLQILTILASQIAISLENSILYESIRSVTERLNLALQSGNVGTWSWNIQTNKIEWDPYMCALHGIKLEAFDQTYENVMTLVHPEDFSTVEQAVKRSFESEVPYSIEYRIIRQDDKSIHIMAAQGKVYRDEKGQAERMLGIVWDITERKRLEEERLQALKQAEEKERRRAEEAEKYRRDLEDFINMMCHEIRNPMSGIYGNVDFLQQTIVSLKLFNENLPHERQPVFSELLRKLEESTQEIQQCSKHQKAIIDDVLDLSKIEAGKMEFKHEPFRLKSLIEETAQIFAAPLKQKNLLLQLVVPDIDPWVKGDVNRIKMALINLISNALKFTEHGKIKISLDILETTAANTTFTLSVEDTGIGMTVKEQSQLFQRFTRAASAEYEGSGLGLMISKRFIERMRGRIDVNSEKGKGSQFTIHLTCETAPAEIKPVPITAQAAPTPSPIVLPISKRILIVEDNVMNQRILRRYLETAGYYCEVANNGQEAVNQWATGSFDFIFMDIEMPVMGGLEATQAIRAREQQLDIARKIPIVALTAYASKDFEQQAYKVGMDHYLTKPYEKTKLLEAVKTWTTQPSDPSPSADTLLALSLVQNLAAVQPTPAPTSVEQIQQIKSMLSFWSQPQLATPQLPIREWMPEPRRNALYPVLDQLSAALAILNLALIKPEAKYHAQISHTGWQLYCLKGTDECLAIVNFENEIHVDRLLEIIEHTGIPLHAEKMYSKPT